MTAIERINQLSHRIFNTSKSEAQTSRTSNPFAASNFQKAIILEPDNVTAKFNLGKTYGKSGDYENAKQVLIDVIKQDKKLYDAYIEVANVCTALGDLDSAEGYLLTLQELNSSGM